MVDITSKNIYQKGFTLIELVMVIAIIGLLSTVMLPNFSSIQIKAKEHSIKAVGRALQVSLETYFLQQGDYLAGEEVNVETLISTLQNSNVLSDTLVNPFTKSDFLNDDESGKIHYSWNDDTEQYTIDIYGHKNDVVILSLKNS